MNPHPEPALWWGRLSRVEWAYVAGLVLVTLAGIVFAFWYVIRVNQPPPPAPSEAVRSRPSALGYLLTASDDRVVIELGNGKKRTFAVRAEDRARVGTGYLDAHSGNRDVGFLIYYTTTGNRDYAVGVVETGIPELGSG